MEKQKREILEEFKIVKIDIENFKYFYDLNECFRYNNSAKIIMSKLNKLLETVKQMNKYETVLQYPITNMNIINEAYAEFEKYHQLWEFIAEKWKYVKKYKTKN